MLIEKRIPRHEGEEDRVPGLNNLQEIISLSSVVAKKGKVIKNLLRDGDVNAAYIGTYGGNKYQVKYRLSCGVFGYEESEITGQDIGITIFHHNPLILLPPYEVTVDYCYGKKNVREVLDGLKPIIESAANEQVAEPQPINKDNFPIGILAILGGAHYIFARTLEEAGQMYAVWCEENEDFYNMRRALADPNSPIPPFAVKPLEVFPLYHEAAEKRILRESQGNDPQRRLLYLLGQK